ncbi:Yip1-like protein [Pseudacidovorax intermedius]|uniref:Yip1-like protein n=2 Tax=Pseudacidovorax intermedius TaxID=433924 RepID=A0A370F3V3_9BURK|nr:Yip1 family protein [Pseudacidovorax intermedius]RDI17025.1 Yip1-like protein [Pseudacidovorax intermedius]
MNLVQRVQDILLRPKRTWPEIAAESTDTATLYRDYLLILAAIPAVAGFIGLSIIGAGVFGVRFRVPIVSGLVQAIVSYVLSLVMVYVLALIVDALAPSFGGRRNPIQALKLVAYASTAGFAGGIFGLLPALAVLGALVGLYSVYLFYIGVPVLMECPAEKALVYTVVFALCAIVASVVLGALLSVFTPAPRMPVGAWLPILTVA